MNNLTDYLNNLNLIDSNGDNLQVDSKLAIKKQDSDESEEIIDDSKIVECEKNDSDYLTNENLINILKNYKQLLNNYKIEKNNKQLNKKNLFYNHFERVNDEEMMEMEQNYEINKKVCLNLGNYEQQSFEDEDIVDDEEFFEQDTKKHDLETIHKHLKSIIFTHLKSSYHQSDSDDDENNNDILNDDELPKNLIVTQLPNELFSNLDIKSEFERLFLNIDSNCKFCYFRIFKRCLIQYDDSISAVLARFELDDYLFLNEPLRIFLTKPIKFKNSKPFLEPPKNDKTFLISPPSSPPIGWEQTHEDPPVINYDLLAALSKLNPNEPCELIKSSDLTPGIIVHPCPDLVDNQNDNLNVKRKFIPTRRPANDF